MKMPVKDPVFTICPFEPKYFQAVIDFADSLPIQDLLFLPRDTKNMNNADNWLKAVENRSIMTFLCLDGEHVVGAGAIVRKLRGWSSHVAELRILVSQDMRDMGIGRLLLRHCFAEAIEAGAEKLIGRITSDKKGAKKVFNGLGFEREAVLRKQVRDNLGQLQDLIIYSYHVPPAEGAGLGYSEIY
jgi:L-amino acid N-acyltransferase YncA